VAHAKIALFSCAVCRDCGRHRHYERHHLNAEGAIRIELQQPIPIEASEWIRPGIRVPAQSLAGSRLASVEATGDGVLWRG